MTFRITLLLPILSFAYNCTLWRCSDHPLEDNQCINSTIVDNSYQVFDLSICPDDMFCEAPSFHTDNKCQALPTILGTRYDNEECTIDLDCAASEYTKPTCTNGRCTGYLKQGETCGNTLDCSVGLWCDWINGRICNKQGADLSFCLSDQQCPNNYWCDSLGGKGCIPWFGGKPGEDCMLWANCETANCDADYNRCANVTAVSEFEPPYECAAAIGNTCYSKNYDFEGESKHNAQHCLCGYASTGNAYCPLWPGDEKALKYVQMQRDWTASSGIMECNVARRFEEGCQRTHMNDTFYEEYKHAQYLVTYYVNTIDNDECVKQMFTREYWYPNGSKGSMPRASGFEYYYEDVMELAMAVVLAVSALII